MLVTRLSNIHCCEAASVMGNLFFNTTRRSQNLSLDRNMLTMTSVFKSLIIFAILCSWQSQPLAEKRPRYCALMANKNQLNQLSQVFNDFTRLNSKNQKNTIYVCRNLKPASNTYEMLAYWKEMNALFFIYSAPQIMDWEMLLVWAGSDVSFQGRNFTGEKDLVSDKWAWSSIRTNLRYGAKLMFSQ